MRLSVVVPAYNSAGTIGPCLDGLAVALGPNDEVIVVDDGSTDDTTDDGTPTAEDIAEDAGLLPFMSPFTLMAMIGLAAIAFQPRREADE